MARQIMNSIILKNILAALVLLIIFLFAAFLNVKYAAPGYFKLLSVTILPIAAFGTFVFVNRGLFPTIGNRSVRFFLITALCCIIFCVFLCCFLILAGVLMNATDIARS